MLIPSAILAKRDSNLLLRSRRRTSYAHIGFPRVTTLAILRNTYNFPKHLFKSPCPLREYGFCVCSRRVLCNCWYYHLRLYLQSNLLPRPQLLPYYSAVTFFASTFELPLSKRGNTADLYGSLLRNPPYRRCRRQGKKDVIAALQAYNVERIVTPKSVP